MITRPCYSNRDETMRAVDFHDSNQAAAATDRALQSAADNIEGQLHRVFYPRDTTFKWDWPNFSYAPPWKLYFGQWDLVSATQVQSPQGTTLPLGNLIFCPVNRRLGWPYTNVEIDRSTITAFSAGATPQLSIWISGTWGFTADMDQVATLTAGINASVTTVPVSDGSQVGAGDLLIIGTERLLVTGKTAVTTGLTQSGAGCSAASAADDALATTGSGALNVGEVLLLGTEQMLVTDVTAGVATVTRAWAGTTLAAHSGATVYAYRSLAVSRGQLGTTAASASQNAAVCKHRVPNLIRDLSIAETNNQVLQEGSGYARMVGSGDSASPAPGISLADKWDEARTVYGRKLRIRAV